MNPREELVRKLVLGIKNQENRNLGEFLRNQWEIELYLTYLIRVRSSKEGCVDKRWIQNLERSTLGRKIEYFQMCARKDKEGKLVNELKEYNDTRNRIVHIFANIRNKKDARSINELIMDGATLGRKIVQWFPRIRDLS